MHDMLKNQPVKKSEHAFLPTRLTPSQLEDSFKLFLPEYAGATSLAAPAVYQRAFQDDATYVRGYAFERADNSKAILFQPATVGMMEEPGHPSLKDIIDAYHALPALEKTGVDTIVVPIAQNVDFSYGYSRALVSKHFVTLTLSVNSATGTIESGKVIDSKGYYATLGTRERDIQAILEENVKNDKFRFQSREYLGVQPFSENTDCGIYSHLVCRAYLNSAAPNLASDITTLSGDFATILRSQVKSANLQTVQEGVMQVDASAIAAIVKANLNDAKASDVLDDIDDDFVLIDDALANGVVADVLDDIDEDGFVLLEEQPSKPSPLLFTGGAKQSAVPVVSQDLLESFVLLPGGTNLAQSVLIQPQETFSPEANQEISVACLSDDHKPACTKMAPMMISVGNRIIDLLYNSDLSLAKAGEAGKLIELINQEVGGLYQKSGLSEDSAQLELEHSARVPSASSYLKSWNRYLRGDQDHAEMRRNYMLAINCVMWAMYNQAALRNEAFARGSFKINDPNGRLFELLKGYVQFATGQDNPWYTTSNDFAYPRNPAYGQSSHYTASHFKAEQYGIDMRLMGGYPTLEILPHNHSHLLFGQVEIGKEQYTILKFEPIGLGSALEFAEHAMHFGKSGHLAGNERREKDIPATLKAIYQTFQECYLEHYRSNITADTLSTMFEQIQAENKKAENRAFIDVFNEFMLEAKKLGLSENIAIRTGNEVILSMEDKNSRKTISCG